MKFLISFYHHRFSMLKIGIFIFCSVALSLEENNNEFSNLDTLDNSLVEKKDKTGNIDYEKRKEIVKNYLESLNKAENDWIEPYDMLSPDKSQSLTLQIPGVPIIDNVNKLEINEVMASNLVPKDATEAINNDSSMLFSKAKQQICTSDGIYISRWLKMLIQKVEIDSNLEPNFLMIPFDSNSLSKLRVISDKTVDLRELDELISNLISEAKVINKDLNNWKTFSYKFAVGLALTLGLSLTAYFFYIFLIKRPITTLLCCVFIISVFWHWMHLYYKELANQHYQLSSINISSECSKHDLNLLETINEYVKSFFTTNDCSKYYEALMVDPFWKVSISVAISETVAAMVFQPLNVGSKTLNLAMKQLFDGLPLLGTFILVILLFFIIIMLCNYRFKFPIFMGVLEPGHTQRNYVEDVKPFKTLNAVSDVTQKYANVVAKADDKISGLLQRELLPKDSSKDCTLCENAISKQGYEKECGMNATCSENEKSIELAAKRCITDQGMIDSKEITCQGPRVRNDTTDQGLKVKKLKDCDFSKYSNESENPQDKNNIEDNDITELLKNLPDDVRPYLAVKDLTRDMCEENM